MSMHINVLAGITIYNLYIQTRAIFSCIVTMHINVLAGITNIICMYRLELYYLV